LSKKPSNNNNAVPAVPPLDPSVQRKKLGQLYWIRIGFAALGGFISGIMGFVSPLTYSDVSSKTVLLNPNAYNGLFVAFFLYFFTYYYARSILLKGIAAKDKNRLITQGIGSYIMMFIFTWIVFNTFHFCTLFSACHP